MHILSDLCLLPRIQYVQSVITHEKTTATLAKALSEIAETLPRMQLANELFPTKKMKDAVCQLYAHILRFLVRAHDWYMEGTLKHIVHSITRPVELRYDDLLQNIAQSSRVIEQLASSGHQAEFRDMHNEIDASLKISTQQLSDIRVEVASGSAVCMDVPNSSVSNTNKSLSRPLCCLNRDHRTSEWFAELAEHEVRGHKVETR